MISFLWFSILLIQKSQEQCTTTKYPVGLRGGSLEVKYLQMETHSSGNILLAGSSNNNVFFTPNTLAAGSLGYPIFQFYDITTCSFSWSKYFPLNLEQANVVIRYRTDYASIAFGFVSTTKTLTLGQMSTSGTLNRLWKSSFSSSTTVNVYDLFYDQSNDLLIASFNDDEKYRIVYFKDFGISGGLSLNQVNMVKGQAFSLIQYDTTYIWAVGRAVDASNNEQAFHHLKLGKSDGVIYASFYKQQASTATSTSYNLLHSDKNVNGAYLWSCGYHSDGSTFKAIYSVMTSIGLNAGKQIASSKCFGIQGISSTSAYAIRAIYPSATSTNYFISLLTLASSVFITTSYNMNTKIDVGISLEKAISKVGSNFVYMIGKYQFSAASTDQQGYLMKMSTNFASPTYNTETCDSFTLASMSDTTSLFEITNSWTDVSSPGTSLFSRLTSSMTTFSSLTSSLLAMSLVGASYSTTYTCTAAATVTIVASTAVNQNYDLGTLVGTTSYQVPAFTLSPSGSTGTITYTNSATTTGVTFDATTRTYGWSLLTTVGTYTLTMQGSLTGSTSVTTSLTLTIARTTLVLPSTAVAQTYDAGTFTGSTSYTVPTFTTNPSGQEGSIVYTDVSGAAKPTSVTLTGTTYDWSSVATIPQSFTITMQGRLGSSPTVTTSFTVTITNSASPVVIQSQPSISHNYVLYFGSTSYTVPAFTTTPTASASLIVYSDASTPIPSGVSFTPASRLYSWTTSIPVGVYSLAMMGSITSVTPQTVSITLTITAPLLVKSIAADQVYDLNTLAGSTTYTVPAFTTSPKGIEGMIVYSDVSVSKPSAVTFSPGLRQYDWSGVTSTGAFTLIMKGFISGCVPVTTSFKVNITQVTPAFVVIPNSPPYFDPILTDVTLDLGKSQVFKFPQILDPDQEDSGTFVSLNLGTASAFITGTYPTLVIAPTTDPQHVGTFPISITIKDSRSATATFKFQIIAQGAQASSTNQSTISSQNQTSQQNNAISTASSSGKAGTVDIAMSSIFGKSIVKKTLNKNLKTKPLILSASLQSMNNEGIATITFNKDIYIVKNLTAIDSYVFRIKTIAGADSDIQDLNITSWNVTKMESRKIVIRIEFQTLIRVSLYDIKDQLEIEFKNPQFIVDEETGETIKPKTILRKRIPRQMPKDSATVMLQSVGPTAKSTMSSFMVGNFALQLVMAASLQMLWGMINVMQIIVHMPLLNVQFPENAMFFYSLIIDISSFNLIPESWMKVIKSKLFNFKDEEVNESFGKMGYESESSVQNLGSMFMYLGGFIGLVCFVLIIRFMKNKYQLVNKVYTYLAKLIFWNMILRMFLEGYMEYAITSLINIYKLQWDTRSNSFSSVFSIVIFIWIFIFPFLVWYILWRNSKKLKEAETVTSFGSTYIELRTGSKSALLYNVLYMLRRLLFSVVILVFKQWPYAQIQILIFHCILLIIYNKLARPFENPLLNKLEIFNELCIMGAAYHLFVFTSYVDDPKLQYNVGWSMIGVTVLNILVNMGIMGYASFKKLRLQFMKLKSMFKPWMEKRKTAYKEPIQKDSNKLEHTSSIMIKKEEEFKQENISLPDQNHKINIIDDDVMIEEIQSAKKDDPQQAKLLQVEQNKKRQDQIMTQRHKKVNKNRSLLQLVQCENEKNEFESTNHKIQVPVIHFEQIKTTIQASLFQLPNNRGFANKLMKNPIQTLQDPKRKVVDEEEFYNFNIKD